MGEGATTSSIADVLEVSCNPVYGEEYVTLNADQLSNGCHDTLSWVQSDVAQSTGSQFTAYLDDDGNANVVVWGGPSCAATTYTIYASMDSPPRFTASTTFRVRPPQNTPHGVYAVPASQVEDSTYSDIATVIEVEYPAYDAGQTVTVKSDELYYSCAGGTFWIGPDEESLGTDTDSATVTLDNNGNAFVVFIGHDCAAGTDTITADLGVAPYTGYSTTFKVLSPRVRKH
jgi:WD40 repeat protein